MPWAQGLLSSDPLLIGLTEAAPLNHFSAPGELGRVPEQLGETQPSRALSHHALPRKIQAHHIQIHGIPLSQGGVE